MPVEAWSGVRATRHCRSKSRLADYPWQKATISGPVGSPLPRTLHGRRRPFLAWSGRPYRGHAIVMSYGRPAIAGRGLVWRKGDPPLPVEVSSGGLSMAEGDHFWPGRVAPTAEYPWQKATISGLVGSPLPGVAPTRT